MNASIDIHASSNVSSVLTKEHEGSEANKVLAKLCIMGRPFVEYIDEENAPKYCCAKCGVDIASSSIIIWEGYMSAQQPAYLFKSTINVDPYTAARNEKLSTGQYTLIDVQCRHCCVPLGWRYVSAERNDQKYKEGCTLLQQELLRRVNGSLSDCTAITPFRRVSDIPPPPRRR